MKIKDTKESFIKKSIDKFGDHYDYEKVEYYNCRSKITFICKIHNYEFIQGAHRHLSSKTGGCKFCYQERVDKGHNDVRLTQDEFERRAREIHGNKYDYSKSKYISFGDKIIIKCNKCNREFKQAPSSHITGTKRGCRICGNKRHGDKARLTQDEFLRRSILKHGNDFDYSKSVCNGAIEKVIIKCNNCGLEFKQKPIKHYRHGGCPNCRKISRIMKSRSNKEEFEKKARLIHLDRYNYDQVVYITNHVKVKIFCNRCNRIFEQTPHGHLHMYGCKYCHMSIGETLVENWLIKHNIESEFNYKFINCTNATNHKLPFDFYIPKLNICIEFDGYHHFKSTNRDQSKFGITKRNDGIKDQFCIDNGIKLIRIPYWDKNKIYIILSDQILIS